MPNLNARVDDETKAAWRALAKAAGRSESELLKQAVQAILQSNPVQVTAAKSDAGDEAEERDGEFTLPFKAHEVAAIEDAARKLGWRRNRWVVNLVRTFLFREPRLTDLEIAVLNKAASDLLAIGRNLNQLARAIHNDDRFKDSLTPRKLDELRKVIAEHIKWQRALLEAAENRWEPSESFRPETAIEAAGGVTDSPTGHE